ncbi:CcdB family protein [Breoghania sp. L-A4]|uniref:CcdB family protein n=1 Tax=Breoghania sp. L-A4 TaxID=2304600 RepID=UPI000E360069|nr:CcdB family protein [Breoghania sp. L-A4]AXS40836.1 plasmid maintenance protein CcdB [Breoghania sp. L-A4]
MASSLHQFDVVANLDAASREDVPYLVILQHDLLDGVPSVVVAPLVREALFAPVAGLNLTVAIEGERYLLAVSDLFAILRRALSSSAIASLAGRRDEIIRCLDRLFVGF